MTRVDAVELLARASHATWMRQKERDQGVPRTELDPEVTDHDRERAEDAVAAFEAAGLLRFEEST